MLMRKIEQDVIVAMKEKKQDLLTLLRSLRAVIKNQMIDQCTRDVDLDDVSVIKLIRSEIKKRQDAMDLYRQGGRDDLVHKEEAECEILKSYLPLAISEAELFNIIENVASGFDHQVTVKDMGAIISDVLVTVGDRSDGRTVSASVKKYIQDKALI